MRPSRLPASPLSKHRARTAFRVPIRSACAVFAAFVGLEAVTATAATIYTYAPVNGANDLWSTGNNWFPGAPVGAVDTELTFGSTGTTFDNGLTDTNTNDIATTTTPFQLSVLDLNGTGPDTGAGTININASAGSAGLSFVINGTIVPTVNLNALAGAAGLTYNVNQAISLTTPTVFTGSGTATFNFNNGITGATGATFTKLGTSAMTLGGTTTVDSLAMAITTPGGTITIASGGTLNVGSGSASAFTLGGNGTANGVAGGTIDASRAASVNINVGTLAIANQSSTQVLGTTDNLMLGASNTITASTTIVIGNNVGFTTANVTTPASSTTVINSPILVLGTGKVSGNLTLGAGATITIAGPAATPRTAINVGFYNNANNSNVFTSSADFSAGTVNLTGGVVNVGVVSSTNSPVYNGTETGSMLIGTGATNHLDLSGGVSGSGVLTIGRYNSTGANATGTGTGTVTIGNLDATSSIVNTNTNGSAILVGGTAAGSAAGTTGIGTLNLNGGTLSITTPGTAGGAIVGGAKNTAATNTATSTVNFNGTRLIAGSGSTAWISGLTNAVVGAGGLIIDNSTFGITIPQNFTSGTAVGTPDGGLTKYGTGTLNLGGTNTYTGGTKINAGALIANAPSSLGTGTVTVANGGAFVNTNTNVNPYAQAFNITGNGTGTTVFSALRFQSNATLSGGITLGGDASIGTQTSTAPTVTIQTNNVNLAGHTLTLGNNTVSSAGIITIASNVVSTGGGGAVTVSPSGGTISLNGTNTYTGATNVTSGTLSIGGSINNSATVNVSGTGMLTLLNATSLNDTGTLSLAMGATPNTTAFNLNGTTDSEVIGTLILDGIVEPSGTYTAAQLMGLDPNITFSSMGETLTVGAVPEPSTWVGGLLMLGAASLSMRKRFGRVAVS